MSYDITTNVAGQIGVNPRIVRVITVDTFEQVTTAGYLRNETLQQVLPTDIVLVKYFDGIGFFEPIFENGVITLSASGSIPDDSVGTAQLQDEAVTTAKIDDGAVTADKLATNAVVTAKINAGAVTLAKLAAGITPSHIVVKGAAIATVAGSATMTISVPGVLTTDLVFATVRTLGAVTDLGILRCTPNIDQVIIQFTEDPLADAAIQYQVLRAAA